MLQNEATGIQPPHRDFKKQSHLWGDMPALGVIVALQDGTRLRVKRDTLDVDRDDKLETIELLKGEMVVFHGLLVHAGADYSSLNTRIHLAALNEQLKSRPVNSTYPVTY